MKRLMMIATAAAVTCVLSACGSLGPPELGYTMAPGQTWVSTTISRTEISSGKEDDVQQMKTTIEYQVSKGPKKGWVTLTARIVSQTSSQGSTMDMSGITYTGEMHSSGEVRNITHSGSVKMQGADGEGMSPQAAAMMAQSSNMMADAWKGGVFWFPELPEEPLTDGDEFESTRRFGGGDASAGVRVDAVVKQVFTLEEIRDGLAYFEVRERMVTKTDSAMGGGQSDTTGAGKGEAVFDVAEGMWSEFTAKSKSTVQMGGFLGMGKKNHEVIQITKITMERQ